MNSAFHGSGRLRRRYFWLQLFAGTALLIGQTEELRTLSASTAFSLYKLKGHIVGLKLKQLESTKMEKIEVFHLLEIRKCGQLQWRVAGIQEPGRIQIEHQG